MQLRPNFTLRNLLPTDHASNSKTKAARCQSATILTKTFSLEAVSLTFKEKREDYLTLTLCLSEKLAILRADPNTSPNKKSELNGKCRHTNN